MGRTHTREDRDRDHRRPRPKDHPKHGNLLAALRADPDPDYFVDETYYPVTYARN